MRDPRPIVVEICPHLEYTIWFEGPWASSFRILNQLSGCIPLRHWALCTRLYQYVPAYWWIVIEENANTLALLTSISSWAHQPLKLVRLVAASTVVSSSGPYIFITWPRVYTPPGRFGSELWILKLDDSREILHMIILKEGGWLYLHQGLSRLCQVCYWLALGCRCPVAETCKNGASEGESLNVQLSGIFAW